MANTKPADAAETPAPANDETAALKAQIAELAARLGAVESAPAAAPVDDGGMVIPGETDEFGRKWSPPKPFKSPKIYQATEKVYTDGVLYDAGDTVVTATRPSRTLVEIDAKQKVAIEASAELHGDVNISDMSATELRSFLAAKGIDHGGLKDRDALLQAAQAYDDPTR